MGGTFFLGWRYLSCHRGKTALLVAAITLSLFLPLGIVRLVQEVEEHLRARSESTPLLLGAPGSPLELVFNGLYFSDPEVKTISVGESRRVMDGGLAEIIPLHARFEARGFRVVGTSLDYFGFRRLEVAQGRLFGRLGECVLGAEVAKSLGLGPGDGLVSTPEQLFDLAGVYPLKMNVVGVLQPRGNADDRAVLVDVKTAWVMEGIAHGHEDVTKVDEGEVLERDGNNVALNASIREYTEITAENVGSFHFHGDPAEFPLTAALVLPHDERGETILLGRYLGEDRMAQLIRPDDVMKNLFATVFRIRDLVVAALAAVGGMAAAICALVFVLSNRLRAREFESLVKIGADRGAVSLLVAFEALFVIVVSLILAGLLLVLLSLLIPWLIPMFSN